MGPFRQTAGNLPRRFCNRPRSVVLYSFSGTLRAAVCRHLSHRVRDRIAYPCEPAPSAERLQDVLTSVKWKEGLLTSGVLELLCSTLPWLSRSLCQEQQTEETLYDLWDLHMCVLCVGVVGRVL